MSDPGIRRWAGKFVPVAFVFGACFVIPGSGVAFSIVQGIALSHATSSSERALEWMKRRLGGDDGEINHDLQKAVRRGYVNAIDHLAGIWKQSHKHESGGKRGHTDLAAELFKVLREDAEIVLSETRIQEFAGNVEAIQSIGSSAGVADFLEPYLHGHDDQLRTFLIRGLEPHVALFFGEELKVDTRAWRAFQRLVTDSMIAGFSRIEAGQAQLQASDREILARLDDLSSRFDRQPVEQADVTGLDGLERAIAASRDASISAIIEQGELTRDVIEQSYQLLSHQLTEQQRETDTHLSEIRASISRLEQSVGAVPAPRPRDRIVSFGGRQRNQHFIGREGMLAGIGEAFESDQPDGFALVLHGMGGSGKSQIALEYAARNEANYAGIWWIAAEAGTTIVNGYAELADRLELPASRIGDPQTAADVARRYLEATGADERWLLVFDNAAEVDLVDSWLPGGGAVDILITSRMSAWDGDRAVLPLPVEVLQPEEARDLLLRRTGEKDAAAADALAAELGYLPLALEQAAAFIKAMPRLRTLDRYLDQFRSNPLRSLSEHKPRTGDYRETVATTWAITHAAIASESAEALELLALFGVMASDAIPIDLIIAGADSLPGEMRVALEDPALEAIEILFRYSLVTFTEDGDISVHRLVQALARDQRDESEQARTVRTALDLALHIFPIETGTPRQAADAARLLAHMTAVVERARTLGADPHREHELLARLARFQQYWWGDYASAIEGFERVLAFRRATLEADDPNVAAAMYDLSGALYGAGERQRSRTLTEEVFAFRSRVLAPDDPAFGQSLQDLAYSIAQQGELERARQLHLEALAIREKAAPDGDTEVASVLTALGDIASALGDMEQSRAYSERALEIRRRVLEPDHRDTAFSLAVLARTLLTSGEPGKALGYLQESLSIVEAILPAHHELITHTARLLGTALMQTGAADAAIVLQQRLISQLPATGTASDMARAQLLSNQAETLEFQGDFAGALAMRERGLTYLESALPPKHPTLASCLLALTNTLSALEENERALIAIERAIDIRRQALGGHHPGVAEAMCAKGQVLAGSGEYEAAKETYQEALALLNGEGVLEHPQALVIRLRLAETLVELGDHASAIDHLKRVLASPVIARPVLVGVRARVCYRLGKSLSKVNDVDSAIEQLNLAIELYDQIDAVEPIEWAEALDLLGNLHEDRGERAIAIAFYDRAVPAWRSALTPNHSLVPEYLDHCGILAGEEGDLEQARSYFRAAQSEWRNVAPEDRDRLVDSYWLFGFALAAAGEYEATQVEFELALETAVEILPARHPKIAHCRYYLGQLEMIRDNVERAIPLLEEAVMASRTSEPAAQDTLKQSLEALARAYRAVGDPGRADDCDAEARTLDFQA